MTKLPWDCYTCGVTGKSKKQSTGFPKQKRFEIEIVDIAVKTSYAF